MERNLGQPTQPRVLSEADAKRVTGFKKLITNEAGAKDVHKALLSLYMNHASLLIKYPDEIFEGLSSDLYYLQQFIEILGDE